MRLVPVVSDTSATLQEYSSRPERRFATHTHTADPKGGKERLVLSWAVRGTCKNRLELLAIGLGMSRQDHFGQFGVETGQVEEALDFPHHHF